MTSPAAIPIPIFAWRWIAPEWTYVSDEEFTFASLPRGQRQHRLLLTAPKLRRRTARDRHSGYTSVITLSLSRPPHVIRPSFPAADHRGELPTLTSHRSICAGRIWCGFRCLTYFAGATPTPWVIVDSVRSHRDVSISLRRQSACALPPAEGASCGIRNGAAFTASIIRLTLPGIMISNGVYLLFGCLNDRDSPVRSEGHKALRSIVY